MTLLHGDRTPFTTSYCSYDCRPATDNERTDRIFIPVQIEDFSTDAFIDTGGIYLVLNPEIAEQLDLDPDEAVGTDEIGIRGHQCKGFLYRLYLTIKTSEEYPDNEESPPIEVITFVAELHPRGGWGLPTILGWKGCLEWIRFAIDPRQQRFYFGYPD